ncbi:MAG: NAD(P)-dependent oxidoreductase [Proteobacteria bacterium]|nr:NAD(P)-dependent oxidoreductase [Pseudomonadota bacterium]
MRKLPTVAFIGLGRMGRPMAARLAAAGYTLQVHDKAGRAHLAGARTCDSPREAAAGAHVLVTMLPDGRAVRSALLGRNGAALALARGAVVVDMSSSDPVRTRELGRELAGRGVELLDAPVSGRVDGAREGTLTIMAGGRASTLKRVRPLLEVLGQKIYLAGPLGAGHAVKALNNYIAAAGTLAAFEALVVGRAFGLDPALMTDIFNSSAGRNSTTENKIRQHVLAGRFASGFALALMAKDVGIAAGLAGALGVDAPLVRRTRQVWNAAKRALPRDADHTEIYRHLAAPKGRG